MSRINTRILRVPGASGQIDERPMGSFMAPMEAAGEALSQLGDLGQQIALKEQELDDTLLISELQKSAQESSLKARYELENAETVEDMQVIQRALQADFEALGERAGGIRSDRRRGLFEDAISLQGGTEALNAMSVITKRKVSDTRFEVLQAAKAAWEAGVSTGNYEAAKKEVRRLLEETEGSAWSPKEVEAQYESIVGRSDYFESLLAIREGKTVDLSSKSLSQPDRIGLEIAMLNEKEQRNNALNGRKISRGPEQAIEAASGFYKGQDVGSEKALQMLLKEADSFEFLDEEDRRLYKESLQKVYDLTTFGQSVENLILGDEGPEARVESIDELISDIKAGKTPLDRAEGSKAVESLNRRKDAIISDMDREDAKERRDRIDRHILNLDIAKESVEAIYKENSDKEAALKNFQTAAYLSVGIKDGVDSTTFKGTKAEYFEAKHLADKYIAEFKKELGTIRTWESIALGVMSGDKESIAASGEYFITIDKETGRMDPKRLLAAVNYLSNKGDLEIEFHPDEIKAGQRLHQLLEMTLNREGNELPPQFNAWIQQLNGDLPKEKRYEIMSAITQLNSTGLFNINYLESFSGLRGPARNQLMRFDQWPHLDPNERVDKAMEADSYDPEEVARDAAYATDAHKEAAWAAISQKMGFEHTSKTSSEFLSTYLQEVRKIDPDSAASLGATLGGRVSDKFFQKARQHLAGMPPEYILTAINENGELPRGVDQAITDALWETVHLIGPSRTLRQGEEVLSHHPPEAYLIGPNGDNDKKDYEPLAVAIADWWMKNPTRIKSQILASELGEGLPFPIEEMDRHAKALSSRKYLPHLRSSPGRTQQTYADLVDMFNKLESGDITKDEYSDFLTSREFYKGMNRGFFEAGKDYLLEGTKSAPRQVRNPSEEAVRFILQWFDITVSSNNMDDAEAARINQFFQANAPYMGDDLPGGSGSRPRFNVNPRVGGVGISSRDVSREVSITLDHYLRSKGTVDRFRENVVKPQSEIKPYNLHNWGDGLDAPIFSYE